MFIGVTGFLLGLRYSVPAVVAVSALVLVAAPVMMGWASLAAWEALLGAFAAIVILQCAYLAGLAAGWGIGRTPPRGLFQAAGGGRRLASSSVVSAQNGRDCLREHHEIHPHRPAADVVAVERHPPRVADLVAPADLP